MSNTAIPADRKISSSAALFKKVLQAFANGDLPYSDVQSDMQRLLAGGAAPEELREVMHRYESIEPLPAYAHAEILRALAEATERAKALKSDSEAAPSPLQDAQFAPASNHVPAADTRPSERVPEPVSAMTATPRPVPARAAARSGEPTASAENVSSIEDRIARQKADYKALNHAYERARDAGSAAAARTTALTAELAAARSAFEAEQAKARALDKALAESTVAGEAARARSAEALAVRVSAGTKLEANLQAERARSAALGAELGEARTALQSAQIKIRESEQALSKKLASDQPVRAGTEQEPQESERYQVELRTLREALAARDAEFAQARNSLGERDAQLAARQLEFAQLTAALESRSSNRVQVEADLQTSQARAVALTADLASAHAALAFEQNKVRETRKALAERTAADEAARAHREDLLRKSELTRAELSKVRDSLTTLQQEHTKIVAALESRAKALELQLLAARARVDGKPVPAAASHEVTVALTSPRDRAAQSAADWQAAAPQPEAKRAPQFAEFPLFGSRGRGKSGAMARLAGVGAAIAVVAIVVWMAVHHAPVAENAPVVGAAAPPPGTVIRDCPTCPELMVVPKGRFKQGSDRAGGVTASFERPPHWVLIGRPFAVAANTVTVDEFRAFITATGRDMRGCDTYDDKWRFRPDASWQNPGFVQTGSHPVTCVSWDDAKAYAGWLSTTTGHRYRLPSAAEWEYAARAGGEAVQPWNSDASAACASANVADQHAARRYPGWSVFGCDDGFVYTAPVGSFKANAFGLNDMLGNVFQWTDDCWHADYTGLPTDGSARTYGDCSERELRGGSWFTTPDFVRASYRNHFHANYRATTVGIRLVRDIAL